MAIKARIEEDVKAALRASASAKDAEIKEKEKARLLVIRLIMAAIKQVEVDKRIVLTDADVISILEKMLKQRRESIVQYEKGNRQDLADQEKYEINIIQTYMPEPLAEAEIETYVREAIGFCESKTPQDMGKVIAYLKPTLQGRADMAQVSAKIKQLLS